MLDDGTRHDEQMEAHVEMVAIAHIGQERANERRSSERGDAIRAKVRVSIVRLVRLAQSTPKLPAVACASVWLHEQ